MNAAQVRAKARKAFSKREEEVETEEIEGGEINLVPYLDFITALLLFALVSVAASFIVGEINTTLPNYTPAAAAPTDPNTKPDEERLQLVVSATKKELVVWSMTGLEGTLQSPKATIPATLNDEGRVKYDYRMLNDTLFEVAGRRWKGKRRSMATYEIILQADAETPYETIIELMDHLRRRIPPEAAPNAQLQPVTTPVFEPAADPKNPPNVLEEYDPLKHYLFPDILFSLGFQN